MALSPPYVSVNFNNTYGAPYNPVIGQSYVDNYGNNHIWDGSTWVNCNSYNYNYNINNLYNTVGQTGVSPGAYSSVSDNDISLVC